MISKAKIKYIKSLELKKNRKKENRFVAEGPKVVGDLIAEGFLPHIIVATDEWLESNSALLNSVQNERFEIIQVTGEELRTVSFLMHPQQVIGVFAIPEQKDFPTNDWFGKNLCIALDGVQDPGNLGTIIRIADWFGIEKILCSQETVDAYSPKVVQATMGSISRVKIHYTSLIDKLEALKDEVPLYGTLLDGNNIYEESLSENGIIIMGNEGNGISADVRKLVNHRLLIPSFPPDRPTAESLNVAIATAIVCAEFRRS